MADRYWVGGTATWDTTAGTKWATTSGGAGGAAVPTASDDVFFDGNSGTGTCTVSTSRVYKSLDCTGFTGTLNMSNSSTCSGGFKLASGMTFTTSQTSTITFNATSGTYNIDFAGKSNPPLTFNGNGGTWVFQSNASWIGANNFQLTAGTVDINGYTIDMLAASNSPTVNITGTAAKALIFNGGTIKGNWSYSGSNLTLTEDTGSIEILSSFNGGAETYNAITVKSTGSAPALTGAFTASSFTYAGTAAKTNTLTINDSCTIATFDVQGNSTTNRILIQSGSAGIQKTLTVNTAWTLANVDFVDIVGAGSASRNIASITGNSGDCGNNSGFTFTTPATQYWVGGTGNSDTVGEWASSSGGTGGTGRVPLPQDSAVADANSFTAGSQTMTLNMPRMCSINFTGATNTPALATSSTVRIFGAVTLISSMTTSSFAPLFAGRGSTSITSAGKTIGGCTWDNGNGTCTLNDNLTSSGNMTLTSGTLSLDGNTLTGSIFQSTGTTLSQTLDFGAGGVLGVTSTGTVFNTNAGASSMQLAGTGRIVISNTSASTKTFEGSGKAYDELEIKGAASNGAVTINSSNSFNKLIGNPNANIIIASGTTQTVNSAVGLEMVGTSGNNISLKGVSGGGTESISIASGTVACDYLTLQYMTATGGATFYAGSHSTDVSNNVGWTFTDPPAGSEAAGTSAGVATASAVGVLEKRSSGSIAGAGTASSVGSSIAQSTASTAGLGAASAVGAPVTNSVASSAGVSSGAAVGTSTAVAVGTAAGVASVSGVSQSGSVGTSTATSTASAVGASTASSTASAAGVAGSAVVGSSTARATFSATCGASVSAVGRSLNATVGTISAVATVSGVGRSSATSVGTIAGVGGASGVARSLNATAGASAGVGSAAGVGQLEKRSAGSVSGTAVSAFLGQSLNAAVWSAQGLGAAAAVGNSLRAALFSSAGVATVLGIPLQDPDVQVTGSIRLTRAVQGQVRLTAAVTGSAILTTKRTGRTRGES